MDNYYYISTIISAIIAFVALILSLKSFFYERNKSHIMLAIELSKQYKEILNQFTEIYHLIRAHEEIYAIINEIPLSANSAFSKNSLNRIIPSKKEQELLNGFFNDLDKMEENITIKNYYSYNITAQETDIETIRHYYQQKSISILNDLEAFCMAFVHNIADDRVVYRSLHQSFFEIIQIYYYKIASRNISEKDCYYTNIISLYSKWKTVDEYLEDIAHKKQKLKPVIKRKCLKYKYKQ